MNGCLDSIGSRFIKTVLLFERIFSEAANTQRPFQTHHARFAYVAFGSIRDEFVKAKGFVKNEFTSDADANQYVAMMDNDTYPLVF